MTKYIKIVAYIIGVLLIINLQVFAGHSSDQSKGRAVYSAKTEKRSLKAIENALENFEDNDDYQWNEEDAQLQSLKDFLTVVADELQQYPNIRPILNSFLDRLIAIIYQQNAHRDVPELNELDNFEEARTPERKLQAAVNIIEAIDKSNRAYQGDYWKASKEPKFNNMVQWLNKHIVVANSFGNQAEELKKTQAYIQETEKKLKEAEARLKLFEATNSRAVKNTAQEMTSEIRSSLYS